MPICRETLDFLFENRLHNSKTWYQEHKAQYQTLVLEPLQELVERLGPTMFQIDPQLVIQPKVNKCISRIYRDTRYSKDKSLFRDVMWIVFIRDKHEFECPPGFVCEISPAGFRYGCGFYSVPPKYMEALRELIFAQDKSYRTARRVVSRSPLFQLVGETYKRPRYADYPAQDADWLERRCVSCMHMSKDFDLLFSPRLGDVLAQGFTELKPVYEFFWKAWERYRRDLSES